MTACATPLRPQQLAQDASFSCCAPCPPCNARRTSFQTNSCWPFASHPRAPCSLAHLQLLAPNGPWLAPIVHGCFSCQPNLLQPQQTAWPSFYAHHSKLLSGTSDLQRGLCKLPLPHAAFTSMLGLMAVTFPHVIKAPSWL